MLKKSTCWAVLIYGLILTLLGLWGYYSSGSTVSLYAGSGFGLFLMLCSFLMFAQKKQGSYAALTTTVLLTGLFAIRYSLTGKGLPAILAVLSGGMLLFLLAQTANWKK